MKSILYVGLNPTSHDLNWVKELSINSKVTSVFLEKGMDLGSTSIAGYDAVVCGPLAAPLHHVINSPLSNLPIIGVSWAYDINMPNDTFPNDELLAAAIDKLSLLVVDSYFVLSRIRERLSYSGEAIVLPFPFDYQLFMKKRSYSAISPKKTFLLARQFEPVYNNELALSSLATLSHSHQISVDIIGDGTLLLPIREKFEQFESSGTFSFYGKVGVDVVSEHMQANCFYLSAAQSDGISVTLMQAMASSMICIVSDFPSNLELISPDKDGFVFQSGDQKSLKEAVQRAFDAQESRWSELTCSAREAFIRIYNPLTRSDLLSKAVDSVTS